MFARPTASLVRDRAGDVAADGEHGVDAGGDVGCVHGDVVAGLDRQLVVVVLRCVDAGVVAELDTVVAGRQGLEDIAAAGGVGRGVTDIVPAAEAIRAVGRDAGAAKGTATVRLRDRAGDVAGQGELGIDAGGHVGCVHVDVVAGVDRHVVVVVLPDMALVDSAELDTVVTGGQAAEVIAAVGGVGRGVTYIVPVA